MKLFIFVLFALIAAAFAHPGLLNAVAGPATSAVASFGGAVVGK